MSVELTKEDLELLAMAKKRKKREYEYMTKRRIWCDLMVAKAKDNGIEVTDDEVAEEIKRRNL